MPHYTTVHTTTLQIIDDDSLDAASLAQACQRNLDWVQARVVDGVLTPSTGTRNPDAVASWRFAAACIVRARRVALLEHTYDADPQLAAMTVDLMEEVLELRRRLQH
jgi:chaperone modulatory protein CbpM